MAVQGNYKHTCACGCGKFIVIKRHHKYASHHIPKFLTGHNCVGLKRGNMSEEHKKKISETKKANPTRYWLGKQRGEETRHKISNSMKECIPWNKGKPQHQTRGENHYNWKSNTEQQNRGRVEYKNWREVVFEKDSWTCQKCNKAGVYLHAHHIKNYAEHEKLRFDVSNGATLCENCHIDFHKIYGFIGNNEIQLDDYLGV